MQIIKQSSRRQNWRGNKKAVFVTNGDSSHSQQARAEQEKKQFFYNLFVFCIDIKQNRVYIINIRQERQPARSKIMTRYDMYNKGFFILITESKCYDLCEMDEPNHITVLRVFKSVRAAKMHAKKNNLPIINE